MSGAAAEGQGRIDRRALVERHDVVLDRIDPHAAVMVGNGRLAVALDITGLQGLGGAYSAHSPLLTEAQWGWHSFPNEGGWTLADAMRPIAAHGTVYTYPYVSDWSQVDESPALQWLRRNPHRFSLGRLSFRLAEESGAEGRALSRGDVEDARQRLDLWSGTAKSRFEIGGVPVAVSTAVHPGMDAVLVEVRSPLVRAGRLGLDLAFPYVSETLNPDPADWSSPNAHETRITAERDGRVAIARTLDGTRYGVRAAFEGAAPATLTERHRLTAMPDGESDTLRAVVAFAPDEMDAPLPSYADAEEATAAGWARFWTEGGAVDLSGSADSRAKELERRIVLSQYLTRVNGGTELIPQEEGLYSNSWNGKFHHEMHWWHAAHFSLWGRDALTAPALDWYADTLDAAKARAAHYGREGAWWPKMTGPDAIESPSTINPFIMWQQPHPIYLAELLFRASGEDAVLEENKAVVFATADLLASFPSEADRAGPDSGNGPLMLGPPLVPVQEVWGPDETYDPAFEVAYWAFGLRTAQAWRERLGLDPDPDWAEALARMPAIPQADGLYLPVGGAAEFWASIDRPECARGSGMTGGPAAAGGAPAEDCFNRDHPSFLMAMGFLPGADVDPAVMRATLDRTNALWDFRQTWGWDFPMMAMTAARLGDPERAVDYLMMDAANNQYGVTGMTPRFHLGGDGFVRDADTYFPSNASLLAAVALMAAGWDGSSGDAPGFPEGWTVRHEGLRPLP